MSLLRLGGLELLGWLLSRKLKGKCPRCNYPILEPQNCPNFGQPINWKDF